MISLNFIPEGERKDSGRLLSARLGVPPEVIAGVIVAVTTFLILVHFVLAVVIAVQVAKQGILRAQWSSMVDSKNAFDALSNESKVLQNKFATLKPITDQMDISWARLLNDISDSVPKGVWLRTLAYDQGALTISGSSVSKVKNEMIAAGNFVSSLKEKESIASSFSSVNVDSIQRRDNSSLSIVDFVLKTERK